MNMAVAAFAPIRYHRQVLEQEAAQSKQELAVRDLQLEKLTSALSNQARFQTCAIEANARLTAKLRGISTTTRPRIC
jgi:hypothetical protein